MKWTPDKVALLRECAAKGMSQAMAASVIGTSKGAVKIKACTLKVSFHGHDRNFKASIGYDGAMARWATLIGPMKARLRAEVKRITAG